MIKKLIKIYFDLAVWLAGSKKDKIVNGTVHLFLTFVSFFTVAFCSIIISSLPFKMPLEAVVSSMVILSLTIMFGFENSFKKYLFRQDYVQKPTWSNKNEVLTKGIRGLLLHILLIAMSSIIMISKLRGYSL